MSVESVVRRTHRVAAGIFLITIVPAAYFSFTDPNSPHPLVYAPLLPLLLLTVTGSYQLVLPWTRRRRAGASAA